MKNPLRRSSSSDDHQDAQESVFAPLDATESTFGELTSNEVMRRGRMGDAYIKAKKLTKEEVATIVDVQKRLNLRFGDAAIKLGLLTETEVREVLNAQFNYGSFSTNGTATRISPKMDILHAPESEAAESIKRLRSELLARMDGEENIVFSVLSPSDGEGKSHIAASLAIAFAQLNIRTMLIDANFRSPTQHKLFGLPNQTGLSTILAKRSAKSLDAIPEVTPNFWVLGSGPPPPNPVEILSAPRLKNLIDGFAQDITVFIVDTPSSIQWADAQIIAGQTGYALYVARENFTKLANLKKSKNEMESSGVIVLGTVFNQPSKGADAGSGASGESARTSTGSFWDRIRNPFKGRS
jgi:chain length determinant protein tyrosine kinase EpsG